MKLIRPVFIVSIFILILMFIIQNYDSLLYSTTFKIEFLSWKAESLSLQLYLLIFIAFFLGTVLSALYCVFDIFKLKSSLRAKNMELNRMRKELKILKEKTPVSSEKSYVETKEPFGVTIPPQNG